MDANEASVMWILHGRLSAESSCLSDTRFEKKEKLHHPGCSVPGATLNLCNTIEAAVGLDSGDAVCSFNGLPAEVLTMIAEIIPMQQRGQMMMVSKHCCHAVQQTVAKYKDLYEAHGEDLFLHVSDQAHEWPYSKVIDVIRYFEVAKSPKWIAERLSNGPIFSGFGTLDIQFRELYIRVNPFLHAGSQGNVDFLRAVFDRCYLTSSLWDWYREWFRGWDTAPRTLVEFVDAIDEIYEAIEKKQWKRLTPQLLCKGSVFVRSRGVLSKGFGCSRRVFVDGMPLLHRAANDADLELLRTLLDLKFDVNVRDVHCNLSTPLHFLGSGYVGDAENILNYLLAGIREEGSDVQAINDVVDMLIAAGANIEIENGDSMTPLQAAVCEGNLKGMEALLRHGANIQVLRPRDKANLLHLVAGDLPVWGDIGGVTRRLLQLPIDRSALDTNHRTPLQVAIEREKHELVKAGMGSNGWDNQYIIANQRTELHMMYDGINTFSKRFKDS